MIILIALLISGVVGMILGPWYSGAPNLMPGSGGWCWVYFRACFRRRFLLAAVAAQHARVLSGMRPTGRPCNLGQHYHGVLKNWADAAHEYQCFFLSPTGTR